MSDLLPVEKPKQASSGDEPAAGVGGVGAFPPREWCVREAPLALDGRIHRAFEVWAARTPDALAVTDGERTLSYRELNERANRLARALQARGVGAGMCVGLCADRSLELIVGQLGVLKAGGAYMPVECAYPEARVRFMLEDTAVRLVLTQQALRASLPPVEAEVLSLEDFWACDPALPGGNLVGEIPPDALAMVIYTSGSTGRPKGVEVLHQGVVRLASGQAQYALVPGDRMLVNASPAFDGITFEVWAPLLLGATCVVQRDRWMDLARLEALVRAEGVTHTFVTTSLFNQIIDVRPQALATLREIYIGGEALSPAHIRRALELLPGVGLQNSYGPTEGTTFAVNYQIPAPTAWGCQTVPIGRPIQHTECQIVDEHLRRVPIGEIGELLLGGIGVAQGYRNLPELTAERFVRLPESGPEARFYRTGDRCRWLPNGLIEYLGRADEQIKLRGFRIELGEIELAARACAEVTDVAAAVWTDDVGRKQVVLFVVRGAGAAGLTVAALRAELKTRLVEAAVPARIEFLERLPLTTTGKMDRAKLLTDFARSETEAAVTRQGESSEAADLVGVLVRIWGDVLRSGEIGPESDFFAAGGDSLLAIQLALRIERDLGRRVPVAKVFDFPTPQALAAALAGAPGGETEITPQLLGRGDGPAFIFVPGLDGVGRLPPGLAERLEGVVRYYDRFVYPGWDGHSQPLERIEDLARWLVPQVEALCPQGRLCLGGVSFGGLVAYELACQLAARGRKVEQVILADSTLATAVRWRGRNERVVFHVAGVFRPRWREIPRRLAGLLRKVRRQDANERSEEERQTPVARANMRAFYHYRASSYTGDVTLLRCERTPISPYHTLRWNAHRDWSSRVRGRLVVRSVACAHLALFEGLGNDVIYDVLKAL